MAKSNQNKIVKSDRWQLVEVEKLVKADWNYKGDDPELEVKLLNNMKRNGQVENIIVRELDTGFFEVVNGNHRVGPFKSLDLKKVMCYNMGKISLAEAQRIAIETNETRFETKEDDLSKLMMGLSDEYDLKDLADTMPWSIEQIQAMVDTEDYELEEEEEATSSGSADEITCPHCGNNFMLKDAKKGE